MFPIEAESAPIATHAAAVFPPQEAVAERWGPCGFAPGAVRAAGEIDDLLAAARWSASACIEQPWACFVAHRGKPTEFARLLSCLAPSHQAWAATAPVLVLCAINQRFAKSDEGRLATLHALGLATARLALAGAAQGLSVHQIIGIRPDRARELCRIPDHFVAWTALAIGPAPGVGQ